MSLNNKKNKSVSMKDRFRGWYLITTPSFLGVFTDVLYTAMGGDSAHRSLDCCDL